MRIIAIGFCALALVVGPALAKEGNPVGGVGVSVETSPGGTIATFNTPTEAQAACVRAGGNFGLRGRTLICVRPRTPLVSTRAAGPATTPPPAPR